MKDFWRNKMSIKCHRNQEKIDFFFFKEELVFNCVKKNNHVES